MIIFYMYMIDIIFDVKPSAEVRKSLQDNMRCPSWMSSLSLKFKTFNQN